MSKWISVKDRLSEFNEHGFYSCIGYSPLWGLCMVNYRRILDTTWGEWMTWSSESITPPTHWMPLPNPPKE